MEYVLLIVYCLVAAAIIFASILSYVSMSEKSLNTQDKPDKQREPNFDVVCHPALFYQRY